MQSVQRFRIAAGPKKGEISDVPVVFAPGTTLGWESLSLQKHVRYLFQPPAPNVAQAMDSIDVNKARQQERQVIDEGRVADS